MDSSRTIARCWILPGTGSDWSPRATIDIKRFQALGKDSDFDYFIPTNRILI